MYIQLKKRTSLNGSSITPITPQPLIFISILPLTWDGLSRTHTYAPDQDYLTLLVGKFDRSREIVMQGPLNKLSIVFHPLGLNHFVNVPLSLLVADHFSFFTHFGETFEELLPKLFTSSSLTEKRDILDGFFLQQFRSFEEGRLKRAVNQILESDESVKVSQLSDLLGLSRKTLLRLFQKHLGYTVESYISVVKFRKALIAYQQKKTKPLLTEIAYEGNYYDQAHFIHDFKAKTGLNPKQLYSQLQTLEEGLFWKLSS